MVDEFGNLLHLPEALVANPDDLDKYKLPALDTEKELERARSGLQGIPVDMLPAATWTPTSKCGA